MKKSRPSEMPDLVADIVIGMSDGFIVPFAITTGLYRAGVGAGGILYAGLAVSLFGGLAMGFSRYYAAKEDAAHGSEEADDHELKLFEKIGLAKQTRELILVEQEKDKARWKEMMQANALRPEAFKPVQSRMSAVFIGFSYTLAGFMAVLPYLFVQSRERSWFYSAGLTLLLLFAFGFFKGRVMGMPALPNAFRVLITGLVLALAAWFLGGLFR